MGRFGIDPIEPIERPVDGHDSLRSDRVDDSIGGDVDSHEVPATLHPASSPRPIDEDPPHHDRRRCQQLLRRPWSTAIRGDAQIGFMDQRRRIERVACALARHQ